MTINTQAENIINFFMDFIEEHCSKDAIRKIKSEEMQDQLMKLAQQEMTTEDTKELRMNQRIDALEQNYQGIDKIIEEKVSTLFTKFQEEQSESFTTHIEKNKEYQTERVQLEGTIREYMYMFEDTIEKMEKVLQENTKEVDDYIQKCNYELNKNQETIMAIQKDLEEDRRLAVTHKNSVKQNNIRTGIDWVDSLKCVIIDKNNNVYTDMGTKIGTTTNVFGKYYDQRAIRKHFRQSSPGMPGMTTADYKKVYAKYIEYSPEYSSEHNGHIYICVKNSLVPMLEINLLDEFKDFDPDMSYYKNNALYRSPRLDFPLTTGDRYILL